MIRTLVPSLPLGGRFGALRAGLCAFLLATALNLRAQGGFAGTVTGGAGGPTVTVSTLADLQAAITDDVARIVNVSGTINLGSSNVRFGSNKTIQGVGTNSGFIGNLKGVEETNVIIQRLNFTNPDVAGDGDGLTIEGCTRVWIDHCSFVDCGDGSLDIKRGADLVTVSWCKFSYTFNSGHNFVNLIGHSDSNATQDRGKLRITFHHNWWSTGCVERMPRVRFGQVHAYNNYYNAPGNNYCIRASIESQVLAESNYFENVDTPYEYFDPNGRIRAINNVTVNCTNVLSFNDSIFTPPYSYTPEAAANVKASVMAGAGTGGSTGGGTTLDVSPTSLSFASTSGSQSVTISSNTSWSVTDNQSWITVSPTSGSNNGTISVSVTANTGAARSGTVTVTGGGITRTVSVSQAAAGGGTTLTVSPTSLSFAAGGSSQSVSVTSNTSWSVTDNQSWITVSPASGSNNGTVSVTAAANTGAARSGTVTVTGGGITQTVAVSQAAAGSGGGTTVTFVSIAAEDGRILESSEGSNTGGSVDASGSSTSTMRVGDDSSDRQYKTFVSFDTSSIPDGATISSATLRLRRGSASGTNPFGTHGTCFVDIKGGTGFSGSVSLQTGDFQAAADATQVATMSNPTTDGTFSTGTLNATGLGLINKTGKTQLRVYFSTDDNDDNGNDYIGFRSGNDSDAASRPVLEVTYQ